MSDLTNVTATFPVVGIGASAGGISALKALFDSIPATPDLAFVVVQHLVPDHPSQLVRLFARWTPLPVREVDDGVAIEPGHVFIAPSGRAIALEGGVFVTRPLDATGPRPGIDTIDSFFESLARDLGSRAIGVVLSGTGADGAAGAVRIRQAGGMVLVQDPVTAMHDGMPAAAIATGAADHVLPLGQLGEALLASARPGYVRSPSSPAWADDVTEALEGITGLIRSRAGFDLTGYKTTPLLWRIQQRMEMRRVPLFHDYERLLHDDPAELEALVRGIPIHVSEFFRDPAAWETCERDVIPRLFGEARDHAIRAWTPACATGEEAYSVAMLLAEHAGARTDCVDFKIFATDASAEIVARASRGLFKPAAVNSLSPERRRRFFYAVDNAFRVNRTLREKMVFAPQDLLADPPFSGLDFVTCRNLLIYLEPHAARRIVDLLRASLRIGGYLFLGRGEAVSARGDSGFEEIAPNTRIYRKTSDAPSGGIPFPKRPRRLETSLSSLRAIEPQIHEAALQTRELPAVLVDEGFQILRVYGDTAPFLKLRPGEPSLNLLQLLQPSRQIALASETVRAEKRAVTLGGLTDPATGEASLRIRITPLQTPSPGESRLLISFLRDSAPSRDEDPNGTILEYSQSSEAEDWGEALRLSHEELEASREELQALNEELRASNDQLNLANDDLNVANDRLRVKIVALETQSDVLSSGAVMALFLDEDLRVRWFTPGMNALFPLQPGDEGRRITDLAPRFDRRQFLDDIQAVMRDGEPKEAEVRTVDGRWYMNRIRAFRTGAAEQAEAGTGVAIIFTDVTDRNLVADALRKSEVLLASELDAMRRLHDFSTTTMDARNVPDLLEAALDALIGLLRADFGSVQIFDPPTATLSIVAQRGLDPWFLEHFARVDASGDSSCGQALGARVRVAFADVENEEGDEAFRAVARRAGFRAVQSTPLTGATGEPLGMISTHFREPRRLTEAENHVTDILAHELSITIERIRTEIALREQEAQSCRSEERRQRMLETDAVGVLDFDRDGFLVDANEVFLRLTGWSREEIESGTLHWRDLTPPEHLAMVQAQMERFEKTGRVGPYETECLRKDGSRAVMLFAGRDLGDGGTVQFAIDLGDHRRAEPALQDTTRPTAVPSPSPPHARSRSPEHGGMVSRGRAADRDPPFEEI